MPGGSAPAPHPLRSLLAALGSHLMSAVWVGRFGFGLGSGWVQIQAEPCRWLHHFNNIVYVTFDLLWTFSFDRLCGGLTPCQLATVSPWHAHTERTLGSFWGLGLDQGLNGSANQTVELEWMRNLQQLRVLANQLGCLITVRAHNYRKLHERVGN